MEVFAESDPTVPVAFSGQAGFADLTQDRVILSAFAASLFNYDLQGAVSGTGGSGFDTGEIAPTELGDFELSDTSGDSTFSATLATAATPEPSTFALLGTGIPRTSRRRKT